MFTYNSDGRDPHKVRWIRPLALGGESYTLMGASVGAGRIEWVLGGDIHRSEDSCMGTLHWRPIDARIKYKLCSLRFGAITSTAPVYFSDLLKI